MKSLFKLPQICMDCKYHEICKGRCEIRRILNNNEGIDEFCFTNNGVELPEPKWVNDGSKMIVHSTYLCTMIVKYLEG